MTEQDKGHQDQGRDEQGPHHEQAFGGPDASTQEQAERIAAEGTDIRDRVRKLVLDSIDRGSLNVAEVRSTARDIVEGVSRGVRRSGEGDRGRILDETIEGLSDGFGRVAQATRLAISEAEGRGQRFREEDIRRAVDDLRSMERMFLDSASEFSGKLTDEVRAQAGDIMQHARRAVEGMRPSVESALDAARRHPGQLAGEAAASGVDATRGLVGSLFKAAGGMLDAAGEVVSGRRAEDKPGEEPPKRE
jgi:ElaB/YqjD/DUF883 family membrane-anchored ribosome-binding protein